MPILYIIATPIGNLEDITLRALSVLKKVNLIATEDTRKTRRLLTAYNIKTPMTSYYEHNKLTKLAYILEQLATGDVALVSEAGMPGISDPGYELVTAAIQQGIPVVPIPGASAVTTALAVSGLPTDRFLFLGFLPARANARRRLLQEISGEKSTLVVYEAPHRLLASLKDMLTTLGDRRIAACRELTKLHEEIFRGTISGALAHFTTPRGEFTLVIEGITDTKEPQITPDIESQMKRMRHSGKTAKETISALASQTGLSRKELYRVWLKQK
jgi:16S rRNA (cytidine1402-2'-O)-methyltransferase